MRSEDPAPRVTGRSGRKRSSSEPRRSIVQKKRSFKLVPGSSLRRGTVYKGNRSGFRSIKLDGDEIEQTKVDELTVRTDRPQFTLYPPLPSPLPGVFSSRGPATSELTPPRPTVLPIMVSCVLSFSWAMDVSWWPGHGGGDPRRACHARKHLSSTALPCKSTHQPALHHASVCPYFNYQ